MKRMRRDRLALLLTTVVSSASAGETAAWSKLKELPPNSWMAAGPAAPSGEVSLAYDPDHEYVLRYGGCTANRGTYEEDSYANDLWVLDCRVGKWMMRRAVHSYGADRRPTNGCNRGFTYDPVRKRFWLVHGIANNGMGGDGGMCAYDPETDRFEGFYAKPDVGAPDSTLMTFDLKSDCVLWLNGRCGKLSLFDPKTKKWRVSAKPAPGIATFDGFVYDSKRGRALAVSRSAGKMKLWAYDGAADAWSDLPIKNPDAIPQRGDFASAYDSKNDAVLVTGGAENVWGDSEKQRGWKFDTWIFDLEKNEWLEMKPAAQPQAQVTKNSAAYDPKNNVFLVFCGGMWAYRYK